MRKHFRIGKGHAAVPDNQNALLYFKTRRFYAEVFARKKPGAAYIVVSVQLERQRMRVKIFGNLAHVHMKALLQQMALHGFRRKNGGMHPQKRVYRFKRKVFFNHDRSIIPHKYKKENAQLHTRRYSV